MSAGYYIAMLELRIRGVLSLVLRILIPERQRSHEAPGQLNPGASHFSASERGPLWYAKRFR